VWEFTNGQVSLKTIATQLQFPIEKIKQIAFRLMIVGLVEEIPFVPEMPTTPKADNKDYDLNIPEWHNLDKSNKSAQTVVSKSFLQNLVGFLKTKTA
jgi:hypothetical protein